MSGSDQASAPGAISLTLVHEPSPGQALTFLASDGRGFASHARLALGPDGLAPWCQPPLADGGAREFGAALAQALLPATVRQFLGRHRGALLMLQLPLSLLDVPWELALDAAWGGQLLDETHTVQRHLLGAEPPAQALPHRPAAERLPVLCVPPGATPLLPPLHALVGQVADWPDQAGEAALVELDAAASAACGPAQWARLLAQPQVPHLVVAQAGDGGADAATATRARLVEAAGQAGVALWWLPSGAAPALPVFHRALAGGTSLGQAAQAARAQARLAGQSGALAWFHGDGRHVPLAASAARQADDDVRQVTVLACDLVDSTRWMAQLGDEVYSEQLSRYHARVAQIVGAHGGVADDPQGDDGFMCYFGFPVASEDAAAQALRAGLLLSAALADLQWQLRIGISTGRLVIRHSQPVGAAVHHAARLQAMARPGTVLVSDVTRQLAAEGFVFGLVASAPQLKGFDDSGPVHQVLVERPAQGTERFDQRARLSAFVGRDEELHTVQQHWARACAGTRQVLLLTGEAGIGKSRLVREFRRTLAEQGHHALECRCAPEQAGSPMQPLIDLLQRRLLWHQVPDPQEQLQRIRRYLPADAADDESVALVGGLLGVPAALLPPLPPLSPERQRQRTMALLLRWLAAQAERAPVCLIVEDVHWVDPSTREFVNRVIAGAAQTRLLLLLTLRGQAGQAQAAGLDVPLLPLGGLSPEAARTLLQGASGGVALSDEQLRWLAGRSDGVPLFIEESARMAAALAAQARAGDWAGALREAVPSTLQDLLMARLDQLPTAKRAAQLGGAIGRAFEHGLSAAVNAHEGSPIRVADLGRELALLQEAGLVTAQGSGDHRLYVFKHALVRDAAHQSLLERDRRALHAAIASVMQTQFRTLGEQQPELLAQHLELSGQGAEALAAWERAARRAAQRSAHDEAIVHLKHALALVDRQPVGAVRDRIELRLQLLLASRLIATEGYGAERVEAVYNRALALGQALGDAASLTKARLGLEGWHFMRGDFTRAHEIARDVADSLGDSPEPLARIQSTWALANIVFHQGQLPHAVLLMDQCLADYQQLGHRPGAVQDPGVMCLCYSSWALWEMGQADQALQRARRVVDLAEGLNHPFSIGEAYGFLAVAHHFRGEVAAGLRAAQRAIQVCEAGGFAVWLAHAKVMHGRLLAETELDAGLEEMRQGDAMWTATGAVVTRPFYAVMRAEGLALAGRPGDGLRLLHEAHALVRRHGERYYESEVLRWIGELTLQSASAGGSAAARPWLEQALASARAAGLHGLVLRAAMSLGRLLAGQGRRAQALALLDEALAALGEGRGTRDLQAAAALRAGWA